MMESKVKSKLSERLVSSPYGILYKLLPQKHSSSTIKVFCQIPNIYLIKLRPKDPNLKIDYHLYNNKGLCC